MKLQDLLFAGIVVLLLFVRRKQLFLFFGLGSLIASIPLFAFWIFFTAQRLVWWGSLCLIIYLFSSLGGSRRVY